MRQYAFMIALALVGCEKPAPAPPVKPLEVKPLENWQKRREELKRLIKPGMTPDEVVKAAGEPRQTKSRINADPGKALWEYELGESRYFMVRFGADGRVIRADFDNEIRIQ